MSGQVVVGVDGSTSSLVAVEVAAREADRRGVRLQLAHAFEWTSGSVPDGVPPWDPGGADTSASVSGTLTEAERRARRAAPHVVITHEVLVGEPGAVLETESRGASLTVVGSGRPGWSNGLLHGSVAGQVAAHGRCPVLVVRGRPDPTGPVLLADEAAQTARETAEFAFAEAAARGVELVALRKRGPAGTVSELQRKYPEVTVHHRWVRGRPHRAVVEASADAQLVVVGAHGWGGGAGLLPGSVAQTALRHAHCPVAVVHGRERR